MKVVLLLALATANGLKMAQQRIEPAVVSEAPSCSKETDHLSYGVWMDGRDAEKGQFGYGKEYSKNVNHTLQKLYTMVPASGESSGLQVSTFLKIVKLLGRHVRERTDDPILFFHGVKDCHKKGLPTEVREDVMNGLVVLNKKYKAGFAKSKSMEDILHDLFKTYNGKVELAQDADEKLGALAWLMQNMAFIHPLEGSNGRSRLMLIQHEIRRNGIGCGTFMFNNNKDLYFESQKVYVEKLKVGIEMYNEAYKTGINPWKSADKREEQATKFSNEYDKKLQACWETWCPPGKGDGCEGTSVNLKQKLLREDGEAKAEYLEEHDEDKRVVWFVRHAEAEHNVEPVNYKIRDPVLTSKGHKQVDALQARLEKAGVLDKIEVVLTSPLRRTLETATQLKPPQADVVALASLQELGTEPCDKGTALSTLQGDFPSNVNFDLEEDWFKAPKLTPAKAAKQLRRDLAARTEDHVAVVTHDHILQALLGEQVDNADVRVYLIPRDDDLSSHSKKGPPPSWQRMVPPPME